LVSTHRLDAIFTPELVPEVGICLPGCTACADACPTGAIAKISTEDKPTIQVGLAVIDRSRCLPWAGGERCVICVDACPPEYNAIELRRTEAGEFRPFVNERLCPGCGICEQKCPVEGEPAIRVVPGLKAGQNSVSSFERIPDRLARRNGPANEMLAIEKGQ
jgi:NAD-dependent dihydropyrimidine dehydrogenase PreA subunit